MVNSEGLVMAGEALILTHQRSTQESAAFRRANHAKQSQFPEARMSANPLVKKGL